ncbi:hypothetical protein Agub_g6206 [Astrephomene gubernaculifera]|uniref:Uncharacterized protein n=1 Tax=Astrephomene gubernaculifera TaxID=47775 RepID=A0AAD3DNH0_9CHLO|nr:hypothetical protein Agub_g6206 [Astrephomene gubernaculifera]
MDLLAAGYGSGTDEENEDEQQAGPVAARHRGPREYSDDDSVDSSDESVDSAELRAAEAAARVRDYGETATSGRQPQPQAQAVRPLLPSALDVLDQVEGPPTFLDPEAIRPLASSALHGLSEEAAARLAGQGGAGGGGGRGERQQPGKDFDISRLAPPLKGQAKYVDMGLAQTSETPHRVPSSRGVPSATRRRRDPRPPSSTRRRRSP